MNKRVFKRTFFISVIFLFVLLLMPVGTFAFSYGEEANANNYIGEIRKSYVDGRFEMGLEVGIDYDKLHLDKDEVSTFKSNLNSAFNELLDYEKNHITQKFEESEEKKYSPEENVVFGDIEEGEDYFYYGIIFSSIEAYEYYYSDISTELNEGFLINNLTIKIDSPFCQLTTGGILKINFYLEKIYLAGKGLSIEQSIEEDYDPKIMFDFVSARNNYISNYEGKFVDTEEYYHYVWGLNKEFDSMTLRLNTANKGWWYLLAITIPLACMGVSIVIILIREKVKNKK